MRRHEYESPYNPAATELSRALRYDRDINPDTLDKITRVLDGIEATDNLLVQKDNVINQKTVEVQNKNSLLVQKEHLLVQKDNVINQKTTELQSKENLLAQKEQILVQKEQKVGELQKTVFADSLHKLYPDSYSAKVEEWPDTLPMKKHVVNNDVQVMERNTAIYKPLIEEKEKETIKKKFVKSLNELYPDSYSTDPNEWFYKDGRGPLPMKVHYDTNNIQVMVKNIRYYKSEIKKNKNKELEEAKKLKEENLEKDQLLVQKDQLILTKELEKQELARQKEIEKEELLAKKELEKQELLAQQEIEKQELLAQKEVELANKSLVKNQVVKETEKLLTEQDIRLQNLLELNGKLDAKMDYARKEIEIREVEKNILSKMLIQKHEILKNLLVQKESEVNEKSFEKNLLINQLREEIEGLNKQIWEHNQHITHSILLDDVGCQPGESLLEKQILESLNLSSINLSPINHGGQNQNLLGNFDINNVHTTHSVLISGEVSQSFEIVDTENFH